MSGSGHVYDKVVAAGAGAGAGAVLGTVAAWVIGIAFGGSAAAADVDTTLALAPTPLTGLVGLVLTVGGAVLAGYVKTETVGYVAQHARPEGDL